jgi:hypothetical protein
MQDNTTTNASGNNQGNLQTSQADLSTTANQNPQNNVQDVAMQTGGMQNYLDSQKAGDSNVVIPAGLAKRSVTGKIIATVLGVLLLIGGVAAGVYLVQQQQQFRQKASTDDLCEQEPNCFVINNPGNSGSYPVSGIVFNVSLTSDQVHSFDPTVQEDGCYRVQIEDGHINWERISTASECAEIVSIQVWTLGDLNNNQQPSTNAMCQNIIIYDEDWNQLDASELSDLSPGETIRFAVKGSTNQGSIDMAKFIVNEVEHEPTTNVRAETGEFYEEYVLPDGVNRVSVKAQLHHSSLGWF